MTNPLHGLRINPWFDPNKPTTEQPEQQAKGKASACTLLAAKAKRARRIATTDQEAKA